MAIYLAGQEYAKAYVGGVEFTDLKIGGEGYLSGIDLSPIEYRSPGTFRLTWNRRGVTRARLEIKGGQGGSGSTVTPQYWAELVRSSSSTSLVERANGGLLWLRTSDGEPLEQEFNNGSWRPIIDDTEEPDFVTSSSSSFRFRFRKTGLAWLPSANGIQIRTIPWNNQVTYRFFSGPYGNPVVTTGPAGGASSVAHSGTTYTGAGSAGTATSSDGADPAVTTQEITGLSVGDAITVVVGAKGDATAADGSVVITPLEGDAPAPARPTHTFSIVAARSGYNAVAGIGSLASGSTAAYDTPGGTSVSVIHCRAVGSVLNFSLSGAANKADFPTRIVATKITGGEVERAFTPQSAEPRAVTQGLRLDYDPESGAVGDVFINAQTIRVDLYY